MNRTFFLYLLLLTECFAQSTLTLQNPTDAPVNPNPWASMEADTHPPTSLKKHSLPDAPAPQAPSAPSTVSISVKDAETLALQHNPQITRAHLLALAAHQVTRETRSNLWPTASLNLTAVDAAENSRISAGALNNPIIYERAATGAVVSQLITDFGHTTNLVASAHLNEQAQNQSALATKEQILLAVDQAFYEVLQNRAVLKVAQETVNARQSLADQVTALAKSKLKSDLDASFADVNLSQAKLLLLDAQNNEQSALASLSAILGYSNLQGFALVENVEPLNPPSSNIDALIADAFAKRPELLALNYQYRSQQKLHLAERDQLFPTISALGAVGVAPIRNDHLSNWYGAVGVNMAIPVFNGFRFSAQAREADLRAQATQQELADLRNRIARDVRTAWLAANTAYNRLTVAQQLLDQANKALDLAQTRYHLGLGSIVELSQAQLQQTQAAISGTQAGYDYRLTLVVLRYQTAGL
jgi:outer membrane protein